MARFITRVENLFKKETSIMIEVVTKEDLEFILERLENHNERKPLGADLHGKTSGNIHNWICPTCKYFLSNRRKVTEAHNNFIPSYCPVCGQKIDWSDIKWRQKKCSKSSGTPNTPRILLAI